MILISGSSGFIGKNLKISFNQKKIKYKTIKTKTILKKKNNFFQDVSCFVHLGFDFKKKQSGKRDFNVLIIKKILKLSKMYNFKIIFPSTCTYKYNKKKKIISKNIIGINRYSLSKIKCEELLKKHHRINKTTVIILRIFNVYGKYQKNGWLIPDLIKKILNKKNNSIKIYNYLNTRDFINISDVTTAIIKSLKLKGFQILNIGTGKDTRIIKIVKIIMKKSKSDKQIKMFNKRSNINYFSKADISNTKKTLKWVPKVNINKGLMELIKYEKKKRY